MTGWRVTKPDAQGKCRVLNIDLGVTPEWWDSAPVYTAFDEIKEIGGTIVLKIPGAQHWVSRGASKYHGTYFQVLKIIRIDDYGNYICEPVIDFPVRH